MREYSAESHGKKYILCLHAKPTSLMLEPNGSFCERVNERSNYNTTRKMLETGKNVSFDYMEIFKRVCY